MFKKLRLEAPKSLPALEAALRATANELRIEPSAIEDIIMQVSTIFEQAKKSATANADADKQMSRLESSAVLRALDMCAGENQLDRAVSYVRAQSGNANLSREQAFELGLDLLKRLRGADDARGVQTFSVDGRTVRGQIVGGR